MVSEVWIYVFYIFNGSVFMTDGLHPKQMESLQACYQLADDTHYYLYNKYNDGDWDFAVGCTIVGDGETLGENLRFIYDDLVAEVEGERL